MDLTGLWYAVTLLGTPEFWGIAAAGLLILYLILDRLATGSEAWKRYRPGLRKFLFVFLPSVTLVFAVTLGIKTVWYVPRPCIPCAVNPASCNPFCDTDSSFPSGHAATAFVVFTSVYMAFRKRWILPLFIISALIAYSRVALGVHTWVDILAGALIGLIIPILVSIIIRKKYKAG